MLARFENTPQVHESAVALHEVAVHFRGEPAFFEQARAIGRAVLAVARQPAQGVGVELIARVVAFSPGAHLLDDAVALQRKKQEPDELAGFRTPEGLPRRQMRNEGAPCILSVGAVGGDEEAAPFAFRSRAGPSDRGARQLPLVVEIPDRAFQETGFGLFGEVVLLPRIKHVHLHGERSAKHVEQGADDLLPCIGWGQPESRGGFDEAPAPATFLYVEPILP